MYLKDNLVEIPRISVVICTHNRAEYISQAIESALAQSYGNLEIIVIDDASTDNTQEILNKYSINPKVRVVKNDQNLGISKSRNLGVRISTGKYIAMLDSDDYWTDKDKLNKQQKIFEANSKIGLVGTYITILKESVSPTLYKLEISDTAIRNKILSSNQFMQSSIMFRREIFDTAGGYDEELLVAEDLDLWLRIGKNYEFANIPEPTTAYRIHSGNTSKKRLLMVKTVDKIIDKYKKDYPHYWAAKIKSKLRIISSYLAQNRS